MPNDITKFFCHLLILASEIVTAKSASHGILRIGLYCSLTIKGWSSHVIVFVIIFAPERILNRIREVDYRKLF